MRPTTKRVLTLLGEQCARIIELNEIVDKAEAALNTKYENIIAKRKDV